MTWTEEAARSLAVVYDAMSRDRPTTALRTVEGLVQRARSLAAYPKRGSDLPYPAEDEILVLRHGSFRLPYLVDDDGVTILGVFHAGIFLPP